MKTFNSLKLSLAAVAVAVLGLASAPASATTTGTDTVTGTGNSASQNITVYGQIPASQYVNPGSYADTITASVIY